MINEFPFPILREFIIRIIDYESITNLKLVNKSLYKFIKDDVIIQEYYLKLRYNLKFSRNNNLPKLIKILDSKFYSKLIKQGLTITWINAVFVNPSDDSFILYMKFSTELKHVLLLENNPTAYKIADILLQNKIESLEEIMFTEGYFLLSCEDFIFKNICDVCGNIDQYKILQSRNGNKIALNFRDQTFNHRIIKKLKMMIN